MVLNRKLVLILPQILLMKIFVVFCLYDGADIVLYPIIYNKVINQSCMFASLNLHLQNRSLNPYTSKKMQTLYQEFQNLKSRMNSSSKRRNQSISFNQSTIQKQSQRTSIIQRQKIDKKLIAEGEKMRLVNQEQLLAGNNNLIEIRSTVDIMKNSNWTQYLQRERQLYDKSKNIRQFKYALKEILNDFIKHSLNKLQNNVQQKLDKIKRKSINCDLILKNVKKIISYKKLVKKCRNEGNAKIYESTNTQQRSLNSMKKKYQNQITERYEQKLKFVYDYEQDRQTFSSTIGHVKQEQNKFYEKQIILKQNELSKLRLDHHKLKRGYQSLKTKYQNSIAKISTIQLSLSQSNNNNAVLHRQIQTLQQQKNQLSVQLQHFRQVLKQKDQQINQLLAYYQIDRFIKDENKDDKLILNTIIKEDDRPMTIGYLQEDNEAQCNVSIILNGLQLQRSFLLQPSKRQKSVQKIKSLQMQLNLMQQQNKILRSKKNQLLSQIKNAQLDEERFQAQSNLLKQQLKKFNIIIKTLQYIFNSFLHKKYLPKDKIQQLPNQLNIKNILRDMLQKHGYKNKY